MQGTRCSISRALALSVAFGLGFLSGGFGSALAKEPPRPAPEPPQTSSTPRGGILARTGRHQFEVFFYKTGVRVFPRDADEKPVAASSLTGTASFSLPGAPKPFDYTLQAAAAGNSGAPGSLDLAVDLSKVPDSGTKVSFQINGLVDPAEPSATFTVPFTLTASAAAPVRTVVPASLTITRSTAADQAEINAQRVCKVSGEPLGSMGAPVKVARGDRAIFLCCKSCVKRVQANPDRYLGAR
jgi:hypothetical protein